MAFQNSLCVESSKDSIFLFDNTGIFDPDNNPEGFGAPNPEVADFDQAVVEITPPGVDEPFIIDVFPVLPNINDVGFEVLPEDVGLETIISGKWILKYILTDVDTDPDTIVSVENCEIFFDEVACCVHKLAAQVDPDDVKSEASQRGLDLELLLRNARRAACCGQLNDAVRIIKYLDSQCKCLC